MGGRTGKSLDSFSSCLNWAGLGAQSVVWSLVIAAVIMIHPSGFLGKENELGKCFSFFFFFWLYLFSNSYNFAPAGVDEGEGVLHIIFCLLEQRSAEKPVPQSQTMTVMSLTVFPAANRI